MSARTRAASRTTLAANFLLPILGGLAAVQVISRDGDFISLLLGTAVGSVATYLVVTEIQRLKRDTQQTSSRSEAKGFDENGKASVSSSSSNLAVKLLRAQEETQRLQIQLEEFKALEETQGGIAKKTSGPTRILMEGAFDLMHYGHVNAFRLGRSLGHELVVGVNSSATITKCKGPPVMTDEERCTMVRSCRFVDEVIEDIPYVMTDKYLQSLMDKHRIDYVVHGDDPVIVDGKDVYAHVKAKGLYRSIPRTEGVSTTDIVGRMLLCNSRTLARLPSSRFLKTSSILAQFRGGIQLAKPGDKIVYIDGDWDMFTATHIKILEKAKTLGTFLIVGVHSDDLVASKLKSRGNFPILDLHERVLSVLGCKYVGDVLLDAPWVVGRDVISSLNISIVLNGLHYTDGRDEEERYKVAKEMGIFRKSEETDLLNPVHEIINRIQNNRERFQRKISAKKKKEDEFWDNKYGRSKKPTKTE